MARRCHLRILFAAVALAGPLVLAGACTGSIGAETEPQPNTNVPTGSCEIEGEVKFCYPGDPSTAGIGACINGTTTCQNGEWSDCQNFALPEDETCDDALDNNCDGVADEGCGCTDGQSRSCYTGPAETRNLGICSDGMQICAGGVWAASCDGEVLPAAEACDGVDNNCNGLTDDGCACVDGATQPCYTGPNGTENVGKCHGGQLVCAGGQWPSTCQGEATPSAENCNGIDDDCDGQADENNPGGGGNCSTGQQGVCGPGTQVCQNGSLGCQQNNSASAESCNGQDDDCDGQTDEGNPGGGANCNTGMQGICAGGTQQCSGGQLQCQQNSQPTGESCNNQDDDCDGQTDEGNPGGGGSCSTGMQGICAAGTLMCQSGSLSCQQNQQPMAESCSNNLDDNCNGQVNENCCALITGGATATSSGGGSGGLGPAAMKDGINGANCSACNPCFHWIYNDTTTNGYWVQYDWTTPQTIGSMYIDAPACATSCGTGRNATSGTVQWWNGSSWITSTSFSGQLGAFGVTLPSPVSTTKIRIFNLKTSSCGQGSNTMIYEWYVYSGSGCTP